MRYILTAIFLGIGSTAFAQQTAEPKQVEHVILPVSTVPDTPEPVQVKKQSNAVTVKKINKGTVNGPVDKADVPGQSTVTAPKVQQKKSTTLAPLPMDSPSEPAKTNGVK
jgi:hypothetical protein